MNSTATARLIPAVLAASLATVALAGQPGEWEPTTWNGERAYAASEAGWRAIVSLDRGRLVHFGADGSGENLLFAPTTLDAPAGWGGHRLWLGPQSTWPGGWPPPAAWEASAAAAVRIEGERLMLELPPAGDGWPRLAREYAWREGRLHCGARISHGTRPAQIIHILQVPPAAVVTVGRTPSASAPRGYVQVHLGREPSPQPVFARPVHALESEGAVELRYRDVREKLGFTAQPLVARLGGIRLRVEAGVSRGAIVSTPDDGFVTQVYLGAGDTTLIELEQLSPLWAADSEADFEMVVSAERLE